MVRVTKPSGAPTILTNASPANARLPNKYFLVVESMESKTFVTHSGLLNNTLGIAVNMTAGIVRAATAIDSAKL